MGSSRHKRGSGTSRTPNRAAIRKFFASQAGGEAPASTSSMAEPRGGPLPPQPALPVNTETGPQHQPLPLTPGSPISSSMDSVDLLASQGRRRASRSRHPSTASEASIAGASHPSIAEMLRSFPTREDLQQLLERVEKEHKQAIQEVRGDIASLSHRVGANEAAQNALQHRLTEVERRQVTDTQRYMELALKMEDLENRGRRNNVRLRGLPESTGSEHLQDSAIAIFNAFLDADPQSPIMIDRIHRTLGSRSQFQDRPRDVICRLHYFTVKEAIVRQAWAKKYVDFDGAQIQILPDLSRATLYRRSLLQPLLAKIRSAGATYRWGFPFHLIIRKDTRSYTLRKLNDLPGLFGFLDMAPISLPDWLQPVPEMGNNLQRRGSLARNTQSRFSSPRRDASIGESGRAVDP